MQKPDFYDKLHLHLFKTRWNLVFVDWTKWKGKTYLWKYDAQIVLSVWIHQMNKVHLMGYRKYLLARLQAFWVCRQENKKCVLCIWIIALSTSVTIQIK